VSEAIGQAEEEGAMMFEVTYTLGKLGEKTPEFFVREALADPDITAKRNALEALKGLDKKKASAILRDVLKLI
jgi:hypothetical protein